MGDTEKCLVMNTSLKRWKKISANSREMYKISFIIAKTFVLLYNKTV